MRRIGFRWFLLTAAACSIGCHTDASEDPPHQPIVGGPISDFPRSDVDDGTLPEPPEQAPPPAVQVPPEMEPPTPDGPSEPAPSAPSGPVTGSSGDEDALDAGTSSDAGTELDAGPGVSADDASAGPDAPVEDGGAGTEGEDGSARAG